MFNTKNILKGYKPTASKEGEKKEKTDKIEPTIFKVPKETFEGFEEINDDNEELFEYVAANIVIGYIENCLLHLELVEEETPKEEKTEEQKAD